MTAVAWCGVALMSLVIVGPLVAWAVERSKELK